MAELADINYKIYYIKINYIKINKYNIKQF